MVSGREFREGPQFGARRVVPAFTVQAMQKGTRVLPPPKSSPFEEVPAKSNFKRNYRRGEFPIALEPLRTGVSWKPVTNGSRFFCLRQCAMVSGKEYRQTLHKPLPNAPVAKECRLVPAFTIQAMQTGTCVVPPPKSNPFRGQPIKSTSFKMNYDRGEFPMSLDKSKNSLSWKVDLNKLDYHHYLPLLFEGLSEVEEPYKFIAQQGIHDMLTHGGKKIFPCIPQLIIPIKNALNTKNRRVMCSTLRVLQHLVRSADYVGEALVPYYRQVLPVLNIFKERNVNCGDGIDYSQMRGENLADIINETLETLEQYGGEDAFINIKYLIPTYESCIMN